MSADPRTDPPTPDPLTPEKEPTAMVISPMTFDPLTNLRRAVERLNGVGADLHWRSVDDARRWADAVDFFARKADEALAALPSAPDQRMRDALRHISEDADHSPDFRHAVGSQPHCGPCIAYNTLAALSEATTSPEATLDVAWREAEAASLGGRMGLHRYEAGSYEASCWPLGSAETVAESGPSAAVALSNLTARLRGPA